MLDIECTFRMARAGDAAAIVELVNTANSGAGGTSGWTHEANFFEGKRTDVAEILDLYADPGSAFVLCMAGDEIVGCAHLKRIRSAAYMGLLSVRPALQARGVGSKLIAECERVARREWHCPTMLISVFTSHRPEVTSFYERRGYVRTGRLKTFERRNARLAPGVTGLVLEWMEKPLAGNPAPQRNTDDPGAGRFIATLGLCVLFLTLAVASQARTAQRSVMNGVSDDCDSPSCLATRQVITTEGARRLKRELGDHALIVDIRGAAEAPARLTLDSDVQVPFVETLAAPDGGDGAKDAQMEFRIDFGPNVDEALRAAHMRHDEPVILMSQSRERGVQAALLLQERGYSAIALIGD